MLSQGRGENQANRLYVMCDEGNIPVIVLCILSICIFSSNFQLYRQDSVHFVLVVNISLQNP